MKKSYTVRESGKFLFKNGGKNIYYKDLTLEDIISAVRNDLKKFGVNMKTNPTGMYGEFIAYSERGEITTTPNRVFNDAEFRLYDITTKKEILKFYPKGSQNLFNKLVKGTSLKVVGHRFRGSNVDLEISCKKHHFDGFFRIGGDKLLECPYCAKKENGTSYIYVLEFYSDDDSFIKVGITRRSVRERFSFNISPYKYRILLCESSGVYVQAEKFIKEKYTRYHPKVDVLRNAGSTECFSVDDKIPIMRDILRVIRLRSGFYSDALKNTVKEISHLPH
jgi:hypothetical protein